MPQRPTSKDVATLAGVSRTTVSFVMNDRSDVKIPEETRRRVRDAARELGYHPHASARRLAGGRSHVLALVLRQSPEQVAGDAVLAETLRGLASAARTGGFRVMVEPFALDDPMVTYTALLRAQHADGLVDVRSARGRPVARRAGPRRVPDRPAGRAAGRPVRRASTSTTSPGRAARSST